MDLQNLAYQELIFLIRSRKKLIDSEYLKDSLRLEEEKFLYTKQNIIERIINIQTHCSHLEKVEYKTSSFFRPKDKFIYRCSLCGKDL